MIDLDRELRALLEQDARSAPPPPELEPIVRRTHRRQLATVAIGLVAAIALAAASIAGATAILRTSERPAEPPDTLQPRPLEAVPLGPTYPRDLTVDMRGNLWWSTELSLSRFEPGTGSVQTFTLADDPAFGSIDAIAGAAREGGVWIVSRGWVRRFDGETFAQPLGYEPAPVCEVAEGPDGALWGTGCREGVYRWDGTSWVPLPQEGRPATYAAGLALEDSGAVWVSNSGSGVSRFDGTTWTTWTTDDGFTRDHVYTIEPASDGTVWVGTDDGVARYAHGTWTAFPGAEVGIPEVTSIVATDEGVWAAGYTGGDRFAARFDGVVWHPVTAEDGLDAIAPGDARFVATPDGTWAVTNAALLRLEGSRWHRLVSLDVPGPGDQVLWSPMAARSSDELWIGPNGDWGIWRLANGTWTHFPERDGLAGGGFWDAFAFTADGAVWASGHQGVVRFDGSTWERVASGEHRALTLGPDGTPWAARWQDSAQGWVVGPVEGPPLAGAVPLDFVGSLVVVSEDDVWAGWTGGWSEGGLAHFDGRGWVEVEPIAGARELLVRDMARTKDGALWVDVWVRVVPERWSHALARFDGETWTTIREVDGVPLETSADYASGGQLELAPHGDLLFATSWESSGGLFRLRDGQWARVADGSFNAISVAPDGTVWLMGDGGLFRLAAA